MLQQRHQVNAEQKQYRKWGTAEISHYYAADGRPLVLKGTAGSHRWLSTQGLASERLAPHPVLFCKQPMLSLTARHPQTVRAAFVELGLE